MNVLSYYVCIHTHMPHICIQIITSQAKQQQFSICTFSESYAARAADSAGHKQERYKEFNSLMQQYSSDASELGIVLSNRSTVWSVSTLAMTVHAHFSRRGRGTIYPTSHQNVFSLYYCRCNIYISSHSSGRPLCS